MKAEWERHGDEFSLRWTALGVGMSFDHMEERRTGLHGELRVISLLADVPGQIHWEALNLSSSRERVTCINHLAARLKGIDKDTITTIIEEAVAVVGREFRRPEPTIRLAQMPKPASQLYLVNGLLPTSVVSILFGDGGSMKSTFALAIAMSVQTGLEIVPGFRPLRQGPVLYADWETCAEDQRERIECLTRGHNLPAIPDIHYRRMRRTLASELPQLRAEIDRMGAILLIVDSIGFACAANLKEPDVALQAMSGLASLNTTTFAIAHESKDELSKKRPTVYGSVFFQNAARSVWHCRKGDIEHENGEEVPTDGIPVGLYHKKVNRGRLQTPRGISYHFHENQYGDTDSVTIKPYDITKVESLRGNLSAAFLLRGAIQRANGKPISTSDLIEQTGIDSKTAGPALFRMKEKGIIVQLSGGRGRGNEASWGLRSQFQQEEFQPRTENNTN